jgi:CelD/BcsL family acetyltransferase involved in cellulose biosynthesis
MKIKSLRYWDEVKLYYCDWRRILDATPSLTIFSTPEWLQAWWETYGEDASLKFLLLWDDAEIVVAMVPLYVIAVDSLFGKLRLARLIGDGSDDSDNLEFICLPGREDEVVVAVLRWIETSFCCDLCQLNTLSFPSALATAFERRLRPPFWAKSCFQRPRVVVNLPATWGEYLQGLSSKERGKIGYLRRRLEKEFTTDYFRVTSSNDLYPRLDRLFQLHQLRWARRNEPGSFSGLERRTFYRRIAAEFLRNGWLEFWFLELNKVQVAAQFAFAYRGVAYCLQEGFDPNYSSKSVGYILRSHVLQRMIEVGMRKYDFLGGEGDSKLRWAGEQSQYLDLHIATRFSRGGAFLVCRNMILACKNFIRVHLPAKLLRGFKVLFYRNTQRLATESQASEDISASAYREARLQPVRLSLWS